jgi:hypothetical protein
MPGMESHSVISLLAAVVEGGLDPAPVRALAGAAPRLALCDLGPALAAAGLAYASTRARHAAASLLAALAGRPITLGPPDAAFAAIGAEACGVAPLPALVLQGPPRALSRALLLACPPELYPAARIALLGHGHLPAALALAPEDRAAIEAALPHATSLAHAAALAGRVAAIARLDPALREAADAFAFGDPMPPTFLPESTAAALTPGADAAAIAAMAAAVAPLLAEAPFMPAPLAPLPRRRATPRAEPLPLFPETAAARHRLRAI